MTKNDLLLKKAIYMSIIILSISYILFGIGIIFVTFSQLAVIPILASLILVVLSTISIFICTIIMLVKICTMENIETGDKVLWAALTYLFNSFVLPFSFNKMIAKTNDNKAAIKLVIFEGISIVTMMILYLIFFARMTELLKYKIL